MQVSALVTKVASLPQRSGHSRPGETEPLDDGNVANFSSHGWIWWASYLLVCMVTLALGLIAALRIFFPDGMHVLIWVNAFTRYIYLPAYACLLWAIWQRRIALSLINLLVVCCHLYWLAPDYMRDRRFDAAPKAAGAHADAPHQLRIFFANLLATNNQYASMLQEIEHVQPDVVVVAECVPPWFQAFKNSPVMAPYVYGALSKQQLDAVDVFSKVPLTAEEHRRVTGRAIEIVDIAIGSDSLRLVGLHAPRPIPTYDHEGYWKEVFQLLASQAGPLVVIGDCNATQYSVVYHQFTAGRLRSAHQDRGRGYATTWPNGLYPLPPIRIDQAFISPEVECVGIEEGIGHGSDHRPLIVDLQLRGHL
jgi:endonuclease/exonuclease/phosphatase (EEP) superfamily protein YafD